MYRRVVYCRDTQPKAVAGDEADSTSLETPSSARLGNSALQPGCQIRAGPYRSGKTPALQAAANGNGGWE